MRVKYESDDGKVSGYGDEGKRAVQAHEADPLARFAFPWRIAGIGLDLYRVDGAIPSGHDYRAAALLGSRLAPLVQELVDRADEWWVGRWREERTDTSVAFAVKRLEDALSEVLAGEHPAVSS